MPELTLQFVLSKLEHNMLIIRIIKYCTMVKGRSQCAYFISSCQNDIKDRQGSFKMRAWQLYRKKSAWDQRAPIDAFRSVDGHAQDRSLLSIVLQTVRTKDVWIADRNFVRLISPAGLIQKGLSLLSVNTNTTHPDPLGKKPLTIYWFEKIGSPLPLNCGKKMKNFCWRWNAIRKLKNNYSNSLSLSR